MKPRSFCWATMLVLGTVFGLGQQAADAAPAAPKGNKAFKAKLEQAVNLGPEIAGMDGRQLRMRLLTIEPGGYIGIHSHKDRPAVVYFLRGTDTVSFADGTVKTFHAGDTSFADRNTTHWHQNNGTEPVVLIAVDVFHNAK